MGQYNYTGDKREMQEGSEREKWNEDRMKGATEEHREIVEAGNMPKLRLLARAWNNSAEVSEVIKLCDKGCAMPPWNMI